MPRYSLSQRFSSGGFISSPGICAYTLPVSTLQSTVQNSLSSLEATVSTSIGLGRSRDLGGLVRWATGGWCFAHGNMRSKGSLLCRYPNPNGYMWREKACGGKHRSAVQVNETTKPLSWALATPSNLMFEFFDLHPPCRGPSHHRRQCSRFPLEEAPW